jgi:ABC-type transport system involved in multi-copper enzyme maturation permease subunit
MKEDKPNRITNLSTRYLLFYKISTLTLLILILIGFLVYSIVKRPLIGALVWVWFIWRYIKVNQRVYHVEFDDQYLYVIRKESDILIPLQNIRDVELRTIGGLYEIELYNPEIIGDKIYYKPSLLYPFNFKAKDAIADKLRGFIERAKRKPVEYQKNALMS